MSAPTLQGRFDIGGRSLYAEAYGEGKPTIIIETGSTMPGTRDPGWYSFRDRLAQQARIFLYDRANLGQSDPAPLPRTLDDFTADLRAVLQAAQIAPPYLLVGCSLGGMLVTHYASRYPEEIHGILLLDPLIISNRCVKYWVEIGPGQYSSCLPQHQQTGKDHGRNCSTIPNHRTSFRENDPNTYLAKVLLILIDDFEAGAVTGQFRDCSTIPGG